MFNQIKKGSRFTKDNETFIVHEVTGNYYQLKSVNTKKIAIVPLSELKNNYSSLDDYITPKEEQMYLQWAKEIMDSPKVQKAIALYQEKEKLEDILKND